MCPQNWYDYCHATNFASVSGVAASIGAKCADRFFKSSTASYDERANMPELNLRAVSLIYGWMR